MEQFQVIQPSPSLAPFVKQYWFLKANVVQGSQRMIPSGCMGLSFNRGGRIYLTEKKQPLPRANIFGQTSDYTNIYFDKLDLIIVVFQPLGAKMLFNIPMCEFREQSIAIDTLGDFQIMELEDRVMNVTDNQTCIYWIEQFLLKRITQFEELNFNRLLAVTQAIRCGEADIAKLAQTACLSYKQFKRIFVEYVGMNPKEFLQITRFSKTLHKLQTQPSLSLNELASECSYYDKSHLIKEFKIFSGYTPTEFISNCDPYSESKSLFQSFFVNTKV